MTTYRPGDRVTLWHEDGSRLVNREVFRVRSGVDAMAVNYAEDCATPGADYLHVPPPHGWEVTAHTPKEIALPAEPGWYLDAEGEAWEIDKNGDWVFHDIVFSNLQDVQFYAPFVRLIPESASPNLRDLERKNLIDEVLRMVRKQGSDHSRPGLRGAVRRRLRRR